MAYEDQYKDCAWVDFDTLEFVLVIISFQPIDLSAFDDNEP